MNEENDEDEKQNFIFIQFLFIREIAFLRNTIKHAENLNHHHHCIIAKS